MKSNQPSPAWPYLCVLACLFAMSISAPRSWERSVHKQPIGQVLAAFQHKDMTEPNLSPQPALMNSEIVTAVAVDRPPAAADPVVDSPQPQASSPNDLAGDVPAPPQSLDDAPQQPTPSKADEPTDESVQLANDQPTRSDAPIAPASQPPSWLCSPRLERQLQNVACYDACAEWAAQVSTRLDALRQVPTGDRAAARQHVTELRALADQADQIAASLRHTVEGTELARVQYALVRRLDVWEALTDDKAGEPPPQAVTNVAVTRPVEPMLAHMEQYEQSGRASDGRLLATDARHLSWSPDPAAQRLGQKLGEHYRNANVRFAVSARLINRLLEQPNLIVQPVRDTIIGADVRGNSLTLANVELKLIPDARRLRMGLEASGLVASDTAASSGPATFFTEGASSFLVRKLLVVGPQGLAEWPAVADAQNYYQGLKSLHTDYDGLPLIGSLVRNFALSEHADRRQQSRSEVEDKLAARVRREFDEQVQPKLHNAESRVRTRWLDPFNRLAVELEPVELQTTEQRLIARLRLASAGQLGAHTPRPQAPSDSLLSVQIHESALNNLLAQLDLDGRRFNLPDLYAWLANKLGREIAPPGDLPEHVELRFAERDAVRVECRDGQMDAVISLAELVQREHRWHDFSVRTHYRPDRAGLTATLERQQGVYLEGKSLKGKAQALLRTIFAKTLAKANRWELVDAKVAADKRLADVEVSQFVIEDGWIAVACAARPPAPTVARKPK